MVTTSQAKCQTAKFMQEKSSDNKFYLADPISIFNFLSTFETTCESHVALEEAVMCRLLFFIRNADAEIVNDRALLHDSLNRSL